MKAVIAAICFVIFIACGCGKQSVPAASTSVIQGDQSVRYEFFFVEGIRNKLIGSPAEAIELFEECIKTDPSRAGAYYQIAQISFILGNMQSAEEYGLMALEREKNIWHYLLAANVLYQTGKRDSATMIYESAVKNFPDNEEIRFTLAGVYYETERYPAAARIFEEFDRKYSLSGNSAIPLVRTYMKMGDYARAEEKLSVLIAEYPEETAFKGVLAELYREKDESDKAAMVYDNLLKEDPDNVQTLFSVIEFFRKENNNASIFDVLNIVAVSEGVSAEDKVRIFAAQLEDTLFVGNYARELEMSLMILEASHSDNSVIRLLKPELFTMTGRDEEAISYYEEYLTRWPENYYAWEKLLMLLLTDKNYEKLYSISTQAVRRFNTAIMPRLSNAFAAVEVGLYDDAIEQLTRLRRLINNDQQLSLQILSVEADALYRKGLYDEAFNRYDEALSLDFNDRVILNNYAYFLAERDLRLRDARKMIEKVIAVENDNNTYNDTYAWVLYKQGRVRKAEKIMRAIVESEDSADAEYYEHYGYILKAMRRCAQAVISWNRAIELDVSRKHLEMEIESCRR